MKYSTYVVSPQRARPDKIIWCEPIAWDKNGNATHLQKQQAFISETKILGGYRYCIRAMSLHIPPSELPQ